MSRRLLYFVGGSISFWVLVAIPARRLWGDTSAVYAATALLLCLVPTTLTLAWAAWAQHKTPEQQMTIVLGGTAVRLFAVGVGALVLHRTFEFFRQETTPGFWTWILVFYLFTLALETTLLVVGKGETATPTSAVPVATETTISRERT